MQLNHVPTKLLVVGASGTGKTTYWTRYLLGTVAAVKFVFDGEGEFSERQRVTPAWEPKGMAAGVAEGWCIYDPAHAWPGRTQQAWVYFCDFAFSVAQSRPGRKILAADELQRFVSTGGIEDEVSRVLETGRRYGLDCAFVSQQPGLLHNRLRNQMTEMVSFRLVDKTALEWIEDGGLDPEKVRSLPDGAFLSRNLRTGAESAGFLF